MTKRRDRFGIGCAARWCRISQFALGLAAAMTVMPSPASAQSYNELEARVVQLEQQLVDMQVVVGTLESLARAGGGGGGAGPSVPSFGPSTSSLPSDASARLAVVETQILALSGQLQRLENQLSQSGGSATTSSFAATSDNGFATEVAPASGDLGFGSVSVEPGLADTSIPIDGTTFGAETAALAPAGGDAHGDYKTAYGHLLQQDYGAAEAAFRGFLENHGDHELAGNARFWLGETHYVRGEYRQAAEAFLSGYSADRTGPKAAESLLKLAMSLTRLDLKRDACATFAEFDQRFTSAPTHIRQRAGNEKQRAGCTS